MPTTRDLSCSALRGGRISLQQKKGDYLILFLVDFEMTKKQNAS